MICHEKLEPTSQTDTLFWVPDDLLQDSVESLTEAEQKVVRWAGIYVVQGTLGMATSHNSSVTELYSPEDDGSAGQRTYDILFEGVDPMMTAYVNDCLEARKHSKSLPKSAESTSGVLLSGRNILGILAIMQHGNEKTLQDHIAGLSLAAMAIDTVANLGGEHATKLAERGALMYKEAVVMPFANPYSIPHWTSMFLHSN